ncbi:ornithine cyclodeaminase [Pseudomonas marginalis]|uniref:ornithine cyclodeaminase n=1 Tax=Pseudomonas marginalis TaxID=298 RepID=UPI0005FC3811|nr:ornithine cyclodeaminase [Pseudomonas marginalis]KJZ56537.1 ornithine cyclodeaminase [Pseudomonas marginalis]KJZ59968.1 ornithine cyclodeaminase [Pseudomonas marginalis]
MTLPIYDLADLRTVLKRDDMLRVVRDACMQHAQHNVISAKSGELLFQEPPGDCHIRLGYLRGGETFVVKLAMGFYENPSKGLDTNNGLMLVFSSHTGKIIAILNDEGWLTSWRTAAAGALAAKAGAPPQVTALGILGTGHQAEHQAHWAAHLLGTDRVFIWGRDPAKAARLAEKLGHHGLSVHALATVEEVFEYCNVVITCTPSTQAIVPVSVVKPGTHIVALGADSQGKQELDPHILAMAQVIMTDDHRQCAERGELGHALRAGLVTNTADISLGHVLAGSLQGRINADDVTVADLTGLAAQDIAIATLAVGLVRAVAPGDADNVTPS